MYWKINKVPLQKKQKILKKKNLKIFGQKNEIGPKPLKPLFSIVKVWSLIILWRPKIWQLKMFCWQLKLW